MQSNGNNVQAPATAAPRNRHGNWPLIILAALFIIVPFLTWYGTWFGRNLSDEDIVKYLADEKNPRHIQHALTQVETRIEKSDPTAKKFYPQIVSLTGSPFAEIRKTVAWVMGQDNTSDEFHRALLKLLSDSEPLVRRNAALQLVRFGDASGRPELRAMLQAFEVKSTMSGTIVSILSVGSNIHAGALLARIRGNNSMGSDEKGTQGSNISSGTQAASSGAVQEFRSPLDGQIASLAVREGDSVTSGESICSLTPDQATVKDALRALAYVGRSDDLPLIETYANSSTDSDLRTVASQCASSIHSRGTDR